MSTERPVSSTALRIGACTLASRITGLVRDMLLAHAFGLSWVQDAFTYAFQVPNLFRRLFGEGALAAVFVPTFTRTLEHEGRAAAWRLFARTLALLTVVLAVIVVALLAVIALIWLGFTSGDPEKLAARRLLLSLTALMLPFMLSICVLALLASILNCLGSFVPAALTPIVLNVFMIAGILWVGPWVGGAAPEQQVYGVALTVLVASVVQIGVLIPPLRRAGVPLRWEWAPRDPAVRQSVALMGPVILGQGALMLGVFLDAQVCAMFTHVAGAPAQANWFGWTFHYPLQEGALSAVTVASRLYQFPLGVLALSLATAALPVFSRLAAREEWPAWATEIRGALRLAIFDGVGAGLMMLVLAVPIVRLLFEYRSFDAADTDRAARVLVFYGFGMWAFCAQHIVLRAFYSLGDVRTPLKISCTFLPINLALSLVLIWHPGIAEAAFAISSSVTASAAVIVGLIVLRRRAAAPLVDRALVWAIARMVLSAAAAGAVLWLARGAWQPWLDGLPGRVLPRVLDTGAGLAVGGAVFLVAALLLRLEEPRHLLRQGRRLARRTGGV